MSTVRQTNFGAGELEPTLHGRTDLVLFGRGLKTCRNFVPLKTGAVMSRPGSTFVREAKVVARPALLPQVDLPPRLIPYIYSDDRSFALELGDRYIRLHTLGRTVMAGAVPYEVLSPWRAEVLPYLRYAQSGAVMTLVSGGVPTADANFKDFPYELRILVNPATGAPSIELTALTSASATAATLDDAGALVLLSSKPLSPPQPLFADVDAPANVTTNFAVVTGTVAAADATHPEREWQVMVTAIIQDPESGATYETIGELISEQWDGADFDGTAAPLSDDKWVIYPDKPLTYKRGTSAFPAAPPWKILAFFFYRGRGGVFGWVGATDSREFIDLGQEPDFAKQPPLGTDPFIILRANGGLARYEFPVSVAFFESRRVFGGTVGGLPLGVGPSIVKYGRPTSLFASANNDYYDHDKRLAQHVSGEALEYALAMYRREEVRHLVSRNRLLVLTNASVWHFGGTATDPLDFNSVNGHATDDVGSSHVTPVVVDGLVLFVRNKGFGARMLVPVSDSERPYRGRDISEQSKHLFVGSGSSKQLVDWCHAEDPWGIVWAVRGDGALLSLTLSGEDQVGWARHDSDGEYEGICSVPEGEEDAVYVVVKRNINGADHRYIERFTSRVRRVLETDPAPLYLPEPAATDTDQLYPTDVCLDCTFTYAGAPALVLDPTGLAALNHKNVYVIAKGLPVLGPFRVQGTPGVIDLTSPVAGGQGLEDLPEANAVDGGGNPIFVARIGLLYTCDLETLAIMGAVELKQKTLAEVGFELDAAKGVQAGQDFDHLDDWMQREVSDSYAAISAARTLLYTVVDNAWDKNARVVLRQSQPLPVTVVGLAREVVTGD